MMNILCHVCGSMYKEILMAYYRQLRESALFDFSYTMLIKSQLI